MDYECEAQHTLCSKLLRRLCPVVTSRVFINGLKLFLKVFDGSSVSLNGNRVNLIVNHNGKQAVYGKQSFFIRI